MKKMFLATLVLISSISYGAEYEYKIFEFNKLSDTKLVEERLNEYGHDGWKIEAIERIIMGANTAIQVYMSREVFDKKEIENSYGKKKKS